MPGDTRPENALVAQRPSDSTLTVSLHPLVLLTISDHITRHRIRGLPGNVVGGLLGQQKGREVTLEHAFECNVQVNDQRQTTLQEQWFEDRLQQYKDVHKAPSLDLVGWYTLCSESGPNVALVPIQKQFITYNESALLLAFHPSALATGSTAKASGKLPLTIYEPFYDNEAPQQDESMKIDGEDPSGLKFRPIPYSFETSETEMIAVDYVAKGGGNAVVTVGKNAGTFPSSRKEDAVDAKGKRTAIETDGSKGTLNGTVTTSATSTDFLTPEEEDQIANMTTRLNSVRMLQSRLSLLSTYITSLTSSTAADMADSELASTIDQSHFPHLRNIKALIGRLSLLTPHPDGTSCTSVTPVISPPKPSLSSQTQAQTQTQLQPSNLDPLLQSQQAQANDASLSSLLSVLGQDVQSLTELGRRFSLIENAKRARGGKKTGGGVFGMGMAMAMGATGNSSGSSMGLPGGGNARFAAGRGSGLMGGGG